MKHVQCEIYPCQGPCGYFFRKIMANADITVVLSVSFNKYFIITVCVA